MGDLLSTLNIHRDICAKPLSEPDKMAKTSTQGFNIRLYKTINKFFFSL